MRGVRHAACLLLVAAVAAMGSAQDREIVAPKGPSDPTGFAVVKFKTVKGDDVQWDVLPKPTAKAQYTEGDYTVLVFNGPANKTYTVTADWINWDTKQRGRPSVDVVIGKAPQPPPGPTPPAPPKPPEPKPPEPLKSFRVILVRETGKPIPADLNATFTGAEVEKWLNANCTGGKAGWRARDKDSPGEDDAPFAKLWAFAQPRLPKPVCVAVERNEVVTFIDVEAAPSKMIEALAKVREGK